MRSFAIHCTQEPQFLTRKADLYLDTRGRTWADLGWTLLAETNPNVLHKAQYEHQEVEGYTRHLLRDKWLHMLPSIRSLQAQLENIMTQKYENYASAKTAIQSDLKHVIKEFKDYKDALHMVSHKAHMDTYAHKTNKHIELRQRKEINSLLVQLYQHIDVLLDKASWKDSIWKQPTPTEVEEHLKAFLLTMDRLHKRVHHVLNHYGIWAQEHSDETAVADTHKDHFDHAAMHHFVMKNKAQRRTMDHLQNAGRMPVAKPEKPSPQPPLPG